MRKTYDKLFEIMTDKIDRRKIDMVVKNLAFYYIACAGFSLHISIPVTALLYLNFRDNFTVSNIVVVLLSCSVFASFVFVTAPILEITNFLAKINFFRIYFFYLPKGFLWCVVKTLHTLIFLVRIILQKPLGS